MAKADNITLRGLLDVWAKEELVGNISNGSVENYSIPIQWCYSRRPQNPLAQLQIFLFSL